MFTLKEKHDLNRIYSGIYWPNRKDDSLASGAIDDPSPFTIEAFWHGNLPIVLYTKREVRDRKGNLLSFRVKHYPDSNTFIFFLTQPETKKITPIGSCSEENFLDILFGIHRDMERTIPMKEDILKTVNSDIWDIIDGGEELIPSTTDQIYETLQKMTLAHKKFPLEISLKITTPDVRVINEWVNLRINIVDNDLNRTELHTYKQDSEFNFIRTFLKFDVKDDYSYLKTQSSYIKGIIDFLSVGDPSMIFLTRSPQIKGMLKDKPQEETFHFLIGDYVIFFAFYCKDKIEKSTVSLMETPECQIYKFIERVK
jgi:hypothetical protein